MSTNGASWDIANGVSMGTTSNTGFDHFALVRAGSTYYIFKNGVLTNSFVNPLSPYYNGTNSLNIGKSGTTYAEGYLDEFRVSKGIVRWLSNFTPPSSQYSEGAVLPTAGFTASPGSGPAPLPVQFTDTSTGSISSWSWDFGDGGTSTGQYPSHVYSTAGTYTVSLTVSGPGGSNTDTQTADVTVSAPPPGGIDQYTKLMLHFNGPNGSKIFTDSEDTPKTITAYGNAQISTAYSEFGGASLKLDGSSNTYLSVPASPDWNFSGDFTIDFWWYHSSNANSPIMDTGNGGCSLFIRDYYGTVQVFMSSNGASWDIANGVSMGATSNAGFDHFALVAGRKHLLHIQKRRFDQLLRKSAFSVL